MDAAEAEGVAGARSIREGIYEFKTTDNEPYVGQSGNIDQRLQRHVENGKLNAE
ncbi:GIY-YIG nuclease family protein, partial [Vibrio sp. DNB22_17_1]